MRQTKSDELEYLTNRVLYLHNKEGLGFTEIGKRLGISVTRVRTYYKKGMAERKLTKVWVEKIAKDKELNEIIRN
jgi:DNA-directed RNA polymerase specialized sigma24 family protein